MRRKVTARRLNEKKVRKVRNVVRVDSPMVTGRLEVTAEDLAQRRLALDALLLLGDLFELFGDPAGLLEDELVDDGLHGFRLDFLLLVAMRHQHADLVAELRADRGVAFEVLLGVLRLQAELLAAQLVVLRQRQQLQTAGVLLLLSQLEAVDERLDRLLEALQQAILLHRLNHHVGRELHLVVVDEDDAVLGVDFLQPIEEVQQSCDLSLCLNDLRKEKEKKVRLGCGHVSRWTFLPCSFASI